MIRKGAQALSREWGKRGVVPEGDVELYQYGLELMLSTLINVLLIIGTSFIAGHPLACITYILSLVPLRSFAGGYHAKTHWSCIAITAGSYLLLLTLAVKIAVPLIVHIAVGLVSHGVILRFAPIPAGNKPLTEEEKKRNGKTARGISWILLALEALFVLLRLTVRVPAGMLFAGHLMSAILLLCGRAAQKGAAKE